MKRKFILLLLGSFIACHSFSQSASSHVSVKRDINQVVHNYKTTDVLWVGQPNRIRVEANDPAVERLLVNVDHGTVEQKGEDFIITVDTPGVVKMSVFNYSDISNPKLIETVNMKAIHPDALLVTLSGRGGGATPGKSGNITKKELTDAISLDLECPGCKDETYEVTSFQVLITGKEFKTYMEDARGNKLSDKMKDVLSDLQKGTNVIFQFIKAKSNSDPSIRSLPSISYIVVD